MDDMICIIAEAGSSVPFFLGRTVSCPQMFQVINFPVQCFYFCPERGVISLGRIISGRENISAQKWDVEEPASVPSGWNR